jgi:hypothetical protein
MTFSQILAGFGRRCVAPRPLQRFVWRSVLAKAIEPLFAVLVTIRHLGRSTGQTPNRLNNLTV